MFVVIVAYPVIKDGKEGNFREWFSWSNGVLRAQKGFLRRRLLQPVEGGNFAAVIEYESREAFVVVGKSPEHAEAAARMAGLFEGQPALTFYEVIDE